MAISSSSPNASSRLNASAPPHIQVKVWPRMSVRLRRVNVICFSYSLPIEKSEPRIALSQSLTHHFGRRVDDECDDEQQQRGEKEDAVQCAELRRFWDLDRDVGRQRAEAVERVPIENRRIAR